MSNFIEIIRKDTKIQDVISQAIEKYKKGSYATQSKIGKRHKFKVKFLNKQ